MKRSLVIEDFGKIRKTEIDISPLTLFVGDNNSGKSYLLSLVWGVYAAETESAVFQGLEELLEEDYAQAYENMREFVRKSGEGLKQEIKISSQVLVEMLNKLLAQNKDKFVAGLFNSEQVTIGTFAVNVEPEFEVTIEGQKEESGVLFYCREGSFGMRFHGRRMEDL